MKKVRISRKLIEMILEVSRDSYPREFGGLLRKNGDLIDELILLPGTVSGMTSALFRLHMLPIDHSIVGSVHSHPTTNYRPSRADVEFFSRFGGVHIICAFPYDINSLRAYNRRGETISLDIVEGRHA